MSLPESVSFPEFSIKNGRLFFLDGQPQLADSFHSAARRIADACKEGDENALRLIRAYEHRLCPDIESDRAKIDAKVVCHSLAMVFHHSTWEELRRSLDGNLTSRGANSWGRFLTTLHDSTPLHGHGTRTRAYAKEASALMKAAIDSFGTENQLLGDITFDDHGWSATRPFVGGRPGSPTETWSGTVADLLDREVFGSTHIPRPHKPWDYGGPTGSARYAEVRGRAGIITQQLMTELVPNDGVAKRLRSVTAAQENTLVHATVLTIELVDALYAHHSHLSDDQVQSVLEISRALSAVVGKLEEEACEDDQSVVFLEYLRYALWVVRHVDVLAPFMPGHNVCYVLSSVHLSLLSALTTGGLGQAPGNAAEQEVKDSLPVTVPLPNALRLVPDFDWSTLPRRN